MDLYIFQHIVLQDYKNLDTDLSLDPLNTRNNNLSETTKG